MSRHRRSLPPDPVETEVESIGHDGRGIARIAGRQVLIDGALPGERVTLRYRARRGGCDQGVAVEVLRPAPLRVSPRCRHAGVCGGCSLQHLHPATQVRLKQERLLEHLRHPTPVPVRTLLPPLLGPLWRYRRKARLGVKYVEKRSALLIGFREQGSNRLADLSRCEVLIPTVGQQLTALRSLIGGLEARATIPQLELAADSKETVLVLRHLSALSRCDLERLEAASSRLGLRLYLQPGGPETIHPLSLAHEVQLGYRVDGDLELGFLPTDFTQINAVINERMVQRAMELLDLRAHQRVLDLYCGLGNFTLPIARRAGQVVGVEGDAALVERARANARRNGIHNAEIRVADLSRPGEWPWHGLAVDRMLLDPPRSGAFAVVSGLTPPYPQRILYVSCNPATLARDAEVLVHRQGYRLAVAGVMDMFPHTSHVESMVLFTR